VIGIGDDVAVVEIASLGEREAAAGGGVVPWPIAAVMPSVAETATPVERIRAASA
jgi:hypothetical protein